LQGNNILKGLDLRLNQPYGQGSALDIGVGRHIQFKDCTYIQVVNS
jgi:hypothetical protein